MGSSRLALLPHALQLLLVFAVVSIHLAVADEPAQTATSALTALAPDTVTLVVAG